MFSRIGVPLGVRDVSDGPSNTIFVGEILPACNDHRGGGWVYFNHMANAHASTVVPINTMNTCETPLREVTNSTCIPMNNWNWSWGFRSMHTGGAQFLFVDGSVHFLSENMNHETYQRLGGRRDGQVVGSF